MEKKEFEIDYNGRKEIVIIKKLSFGEKNDLAEEVTDIRFNGPNPQIYIRTGKLKEISILKSLIKAPFPVNITEIRNLDSELGNKIYMEVDKLSRLSEEKKED